MIKKFEKFFLLVSLVAIPPLVGFLNGLVCGLAVAG